MKSKDAPSPPAALPLAEEHFETFDESGTSLALVSRSNVHREGLWHRSANVFLFCPNGQLLIQRRQHSKDVWPGAWDVSAAEHLRPGESFEQGAIRGLCEELGVAATELEPLGEVVKSRLEVEASGVKDYEFQQSFRTTYGGPISPDFGEVMDTRWMTLVELEAAFLQHPEEFTPWFRERATRLDLFSLAERKA